jgi:hypothetical protein
MPIYNNLRVYVAGVGAAPTPYAYEAHGLSTLPYLHYSLTSQLSIK